MRGGGCETEKCPKTPDGKHDWKKGAGHMYFCSKCDCTFMDS